MSCLRGCCPDQPTHYKSVRLGVTSERMKADRAEEKDMHAFKRLVQSGVQPQKIEGAAVLERQASTKFEVENASILTNAKERSRLSRALQDAPAPATTPLRPDAA